MKVIEFVGLPRAGKSTQIALLKSFFESHGKMVIVISDGEISEKVQVPHSELFAWNQIFFSLILDEYLKHKNSSDYDICILDRGFYDQTVWSEVDVIMGSCTRKKKEIIDSLFEKYRKEVDTPIYFSCPYEICQERNRETNDTNGIDVILDKDLFINLDVAYKKLLENFREEIAVIDSQGAPEEIFLELEKRVRYLVGL